MRQILLSLMLGLAATTITTAADAEDAASRAPKSDRKYVTVTLNPIATAIGRFGGNIELVPFKHHGLSLSGFFAYTTENVYANGDAAQSRQERVSSWGGELGYRFYSGSRGANGFFIGPSLLVHPIFYAMNTPDNQGMATSLHGIGGALDLGGQVVTSFGLTLGAGAGVQYLPYTLPRGHQPEVLGVMDINVPVLPRILATAGWSF